MIVVHHLNNSRSQRVLWLLEEIGLDYEVRRYERDSQTMLAPPELKAVHPLGKSPVVELEGAVLAETGAIVEELVERFAPALAPAREAPEYRRYRYWLHYAEGSAMPPLLLRLIFDRLRGPAVPLPLRPFARLLAGGVDRSFIAPQLATHLDFMEAALGDADWFAGADFSAADIQMSYPLEAAAMRAGLDGSRPRLFDFLSRIHARPAYRRALERGGRYDLVA